MAQFRFIILKYMRSNVVAAGVGVWWWIVASLFMLCSCGHTQPEGYSLKLDSLAEHAVAWQYRNIDTLHDYADRLLTLAKDDGDDAHQADALNLLAQYSFQQMDFDQATSLAEQVLQTTRNQVERLKADVTLMRVAQRTGDNRSFFVHRNNAEKRIHRIEEEKAILSAHQLKAYNRACGDFHIVSSTYFYYLDQPQRSVEEIRAAAPFCQLDADTASWLYYSYMRGSGGLSERTAHDDVVAYEFEHLFRCFTMAKTQGYLFFHANALQSLATMFSDSARVSVISDRYPDAVDYLQTLFGCDSTTVSPESTATQMAFDALGLFVAYDDLFQSACAMRTLGELCFADGRYEEALDCYAEALDCVNRHHLRYYAAQDEPMLLEPYSPRHDSLSVERQWLQDPRVKTVPEWIAGIRQQMSVTFAAMGDKPASDYNRNIYLDLLEETQRDLESEVRMEELKAESRELRTTLIMLVSLALALALLVWILMRAWRRQGRRQAHRLRQAVHKLLMQVRNQQTLMSEEEDELVEQQQATLMRIERSKRQNIEKHAKLQLVSSIVPFLDRIVHEVQRMQKTGTVQSSGLEYIDELVERINDYNALLTEWIQMERGQLSLQLSSFELAPLFISLAKARYAYDQKQLSLVVEPADFTVKADRALTLFMLNTLAENARKFTPAGGQVTISAVAGQNEDGSYVELSVQDTGNGIDQQTIDTILNNKVFSPTLHPNGSQPTGEGKGFGFGLMNCKGIIEKYRKTNPLFAVCRFGIESTVGQGSRFFFRLPRVVVMLAMIMLGCVLPGSISAGNYAESTAQVTATQLHAEALRHADSLYFCNIEGRYVAGLEHADSAITALNTLHSKSYPSDTISMTLQAEPFAASDMLLTAEYAWALSGHKIDFSLVLGLRNEIAVAALALHDWTLYRNNNSSYTRLYKWLHRDVTIETFSEQMQKSHTNQRVAMVLIVVVLLLACLALYFFYVRPLLAYRRSVTTLRRRRYDQMLQVQKARSAQQRDKLEMMADEHQRSLYEEERLHVQNMIMDNCLSTIKHETMYYPPRIKQLAARQQLDALAEVIGFYKEVYTILCAQAAEQASVINFHRQRLTAQGTLDHAQHHLRAKARKLHLNVELITDNQLGQQEFRADQQALDILVDALIDAQLSALQSSQTASNENVVTWTLACHADDAFAKFSFHIPTAQLTRAQLHDLFAPHPDGFPYLLAKQVIREHDTYLGHPGCRIQAEPASPGIIVWWTIPLIVSQE